MQSLERNGFTAKQVETSLHGVYGTRQLDFRYELLSSSNVVLRDLDNVLSAEITYESLADIKRTGSLEIQDDGTVNFLSHRIRPWARLSMPTVPVPGAVRASDTYDEAVLESVKGLLARWKFDEQTGTTQASDSSGLGNHATYGAGAVLQQSSLLEGQGLAVSLTSASNSNVSIPGAGFLNGLTAMSFAGWFQTPTVGTSVKLLETVVGDSWLDMTGDWTSLTENWQDFSGGDVGGILIDFTVDRAVRVTLYLNNQTVVATTPPNSHTTERLFFAFTWTSGGTMNLYLNGELVTSIPSGVIGALAGIAALTVGGSGFVGKVDDFLFSSRVLTASTLRSLWSTGAAVGFGAREGRTFVEWPLGVFLMSTPTRTVDEAGVATRKIDTYDQAVVLRSQKEGQPYFVGAGSNYTAAIQELLSTTPGVPNFLVTPSTKTLPAQMMWEAGTDRLTIINALTTAIDYEALFFDENGVAIVRPYVAPQDRSPEYVYDTSSISVLIPGAEETLDLFDQPNQWVMVVSEPDRPPLVATYTNTDPASPTSTVSRGRVVTDFRTAEVDVVDQATLNAKVKNLAQEATQVFEEVEFSTAVMPIHSHRDVLTLVYPDLDVDGVFAETLWTFELRAGAEMRHVARRTVTLNGTLT